MYITSLDSSGNPSTVLAATTSFSATDVTCSTCQETTNPDSTTSPSTTKLVTGDFGSSPVPVQAGQQYALLLRSTSQIDWMFDPDSYQDGFSGGYTDGMIVRSEDPPSYSTWSAILDPPGLDAIFAIYLDGTTTSSPPVNSAEQTVSAGDTVSTIGSDGTATASDPIGTSVTSPIDGTVKVEENVTTTQQPPTASYDFFGQQTDITVPGASTPDNPYTLKFVIDSSLLSFYGETKLDFSHHAA